MTTIDHFHTTDDDTGEQFTVRKEVWPELVQRVIDGSLSFVDARHWAPNERERLFAAIYNMNILPAGRHLWVTGTDNRYSRNCWVVGFNEQLSWHFAWQFSRLMEGGGTGANYSEDLIGMLPPITGRVFVDFICDPAHPDIAEMSDFVNLGTYTGAALQVPDSREGWAEAISTIIDLGAEPGDHSITIDVSKVRPKGAELKTMGGTASGPAPLVRAIAEIAEIINRKHGARLDWRACMDIDHATAQAVVAGGVRRSARMAMLHWADPGIFDFIDCKADHMSHWSTNISVEVDEDYFAALEDPSHGMHQHANEVLDLVASRAVANGEPGFANTALANIGERERVRCSNPCGEIFMSGIDLRYGESCNLGHVNLANFVGDNDGAEEMFRLVTRFLVRATMNTYPEPLAADVEGRNRRIGVGILGFQEWLVGRGVKWSESATDKTTRRLLNRFREVVRAEADRFCDELGIPRCIKVTTVAPTGTISQLAGVTSGIHPVLFRYFIRNVRYSDNDPALPRLASQGYVIRDDIYAAATKVVSFPVLDPIVARFPDSVDLIEEQGDLSVDQMLAVQAMVQETWCGGDDGNAVSFTVNMPAGLAPDDARDAIRKWLPHLKGTTLFPNESRPMSPYEPISQEFYLAEMDRLGLAVAVGAGDLSCKGAACPVR